MINFRLIRHLWLFLAVAEERHFGRAAMKLGMTQPPLTEQIQVLEQALQAKLFERSRRGTQLTPTGLAILPEVRKLATHLERIELAVREASRGQQGLLTIGAVTAVMMDILPQLMAQLRLRHPQTTISIQEINSADAAHALRAGDIDLALARLEGPLGPDIATETLHEELLAVALPPDHPLCIHSALKRIDLAHEDFVMFHRRVSPSHFDALIQTCTEAGFTPRIVHEVDSVVSQLGFVACGQGVALVPASIQKMAPPAVTIRPLLDTRKVVTLSIAWSTKRIHPMAQDAVELVKTIQRSDPLFTPPSPIPPPAN